MTTRLLRCPRCGFTEERTAIGMKEPSTWCSECCDEAQDAVQMERLATAVAGFKLRGAGFHTVDYPKGNAEKIKDYGLEAHDSTDPDSDYNQDGYADEMVSSAPSVKVAKEVAKRFDRK